MASNSFDPDAYLASKSSSNGFDPDAYLAQKQPIQGAFTKAGVNAALSIPGVTGGPLNMVSKSNDVINQLASKAGDVVENRLKTQGTDLGPLGSPPRNVKVNPLLAKAAGKVVKYGPTAVSMAASPIDNPQLIQKGANLAGRSLAGGVEKMTGIPAESTASAFTKPTSLFTAPSEKAISKAYGASEFPNFASKNIDDIIESGTSSYSSTIKRGTKALQDYVEKGDHNPAEILKGRQALDKQIALLQNQINISKQAGKTALQNALQDKLNLRQSFNRALDIMAPKLRAADAMAAERFKVAPFRRLTLPGKIHLFSPEGALRGVPGAPTAVGLGASATGAGAKVAGQFTRPLSIPLSLQRAYSEDDQNAGQ